MADLISQADYTALTGKTPPDGRYSAVLGLATARLEQLLGWPLDPGAWPNQYEETGKATAGCPPYASDDLAPADELPEGHKYRLYPYEPGKPWLMIDPAGAVHTVKLVYGTVACRTLESHQYRPEMKNGAVPYTKSLRLLPDVLSALTGWYEQCPSAAEAQVAVDADWLYPMTEPDEGDPALTVPAELKSVLVDMISWLFDEKKYLNSESLETHSWSKGNRDDNPESVHAAVIRQFAGPHGLATVRPAG